MAGKKQTQTPEEKLAQALVPQDQQPYELPKGWVWTYIGNCFEVKSSKRIHKSDWKSKGVPFYRTRELVKLSESGYVNNELFISPDLYNELKAEYGVPSENDLLISGVGTIGIPYIVKNHKFYFKDGNVLWFKQKNIIDSKYAYYFYKSLFLINQIHQMSAGTTVDTYTIINANKTLIPLPPLPEQQRIVARIESLFAKLDAAREKLQQVLDTQEARKAAILHEAFTGRMTEKRSEECRGKREEGSSQKPEKWTYVKFDNCIEQMQNGLSKRRGDSGKDVIVLRLNDLSSGKIDISQGRTILLDDKEQNRYLLKNNDVLMIRVNGSKEKVAKQFLYNDLGEVAFCDHLIRIRYKENINPAYMIYFTGTQTYKKYVQDNMVSSAGQNTISRKGMQNLLIPLPSFEIQNKIVQKLNEIFRRFDIIESEINSTLSLIDLLKKSILARAFRGELGTQDPSDPDARELLL